METILDAVKAFIDVIIHLDKYLNTIIGNYGTWTYLLLFLIIFCETGLVVTPFLPGDSLLFAVGALAATGSLEVGLLAVLLTVAAILGDAVNYWIGHLLGPKVFAAEKGRFFKKEYLVKTHEFYERHGGKTIVLARFVPIIRTFAPFVAGIGNMSYGHFLTYNIAGGIAWICAFTFGGYYFGNIPFVKENFSVVVVAIILISVLPGVIEVLRGRRKTATESEA